MCGWRWFLSLLLLGACERPHSQVDVRLVAEPSSFGAGVDGYRIELRRGANGALEETREATATPLELPIEVPVVPLLDDASKRFTIVAELRQGGRVIGTQRAIGRFEQN